MSNKHNVPEANQKMQSMKYEIADEYPTDNIDVGWETEHSAAQSEKKNSGANAHQSGNQTRSKSKNR